MKSQQTPTSAGTPPTNSRTSSTPTHKPATTTVNATPNDPYDVPALLEKANAWRWGTALPRQMLTRQEDY